MTARFKVVVNNVSKDTTEAFRSLHRSAQDGQIIGSLFVAMYDGRYYVTGATGECDRNPVWALGILEVLKANLVAKIQRAEAAGE